MKSLTVALLLALALAVVCDDCNTRRLIYHEFKEGYTWGEFGGKKHILATNPSQCTPLTVREEHGWNNCCFLEIFYTNPKTNRQQQATGCYPVPQDKLEGSYAEFAAYLKEMAKAVEDANPEEVTKASAYILCGEKQNNAPSSFLKKH